MPWTHRNLYHVKTGAFPLSGASLKTGITASSGDRASFWKCTDMALGNLPTEPEETVTPYASGTVFNLTATFTQGSRANEIRRTGDVADVSINGDAGTDASASSSIASTPTGSTIDVTVISRFNPSSTTVSGTTWFDGFSSPNEPADEDPHDILFRVVPNGVAGSGHSDATVIVSYACDLTPFNPTFSPQFDVRMADRACVITDFEIQWSTDGVNNDAGSGATVGNENHLLVAQSAYDQDITRYYRYRIIGGTFSGWTAINFVDPREAV